MANPPVLLASSGEFNTSETSPSPRDMDDDVEYDKVSCRLKVRVHARPCSVETHREEQKAKDAERGRLWKLA